MTNREKTWALLEKCNALYPEEVKEVYYKAMHVDQMSFEELQAKLNAGETVALKPPPEEARVKFWSEHEELKAAMKELIVFMIDNFSINEETVDEEDLRKELDSIFRTPTGSSLEYYKSLDVSEEAFPALIVKRALKENSLQLIVVPEWKQLAKRYTPYITTKETKDE